MLYNYDLSSINLSDNSLYDEGAKLISEGIRNNNHIISVNLSCNGLTSEGGKYIFESLMSNNALIDLNISSKGGKIRNNIQAKGC